MLTVKAQSPKLFTSTTLKDETTDRQNASSVQTKKSCKPTHKHTQIAAHLILHNGTHNYIF